MIKIVKEPPAVFIGGKKIIGAKVHNVSESEINIEYDLLNDVLIEEYPDLLITDIDHISSSEVPNAEAFQIYKASGAFHFNIFFYNSEGEWRKNLSIRSLYREIVDLASSKYRDSSIEYSLDEDCLNLTFQFADKRGPIISAINGFLNCARNLLLDAEARLLGFAWKSEYETDELLFTNELVIPLISKLGFSHVRYNGGKNEFGKDVLFSEIDRFFNVRYCAAQIKAGDVSGASSSLVDKIIGQIDDTFSIPYDGPGPHKNHYISELYVICSGKYTNNAIQKINNKISGVLKGSVHFLDKADIIWLINKNWPF